MTTDPQGTPTNPDAAADGVRLQKVMASAGVASRRRIRASAT